MKYVDIPSKLNGTIAYSTNDEAITNSLMNILSTQQGTVPGHPEFGSDIGKYLFELIDPRIMLLVEESIRYAVNRWEPRVNIIDIDVIEDSDYNRILIKFKYSINSDPENMERDFIYKFQI